MMNEPPEERQNKKGGTMETLGVLLIIAGVGLVAVGLVLVLLNRSTGGAGLPGDVTVQTNNVIVSMPCLTMIIVSIVGSVLLTVVLNILVRLFNR